MVGRRGLTAILQVEYPEGYGVLNNVTEKALKHLGLWPQDIENASEAEVYEVVNQLLLRLASELGGCPRIRVRNPQVLASKQLASFEPN